MSLLSDRILEYHFSLPADWALPEGIELLYPYSNAETRRVMHHFYGKYYGDERERVLLLGINPGRHGAGVTGVPFTDPIKLETECGIQNAFHKRPELSSDFVYRVVNALGGPRTFYRRFYISSICPLGFIKDGKNYNYYDAKTLERAVEPHVLDHLRAQIEMGCSDRVAFSMGKGKNYAYLKKLNAQYGFFGKVLPLPHPRWVMQYRRKRLEEYVKTYQVGLDQC